MIRRDGIGELPRIKAAESLAYLAIIGSVDTEMVIEDLRDLAGTATDREAGEAAAKTAGLLGNNTVSMDEIREIWRSW